MKVLVILSLFLISQASFAKGSLSSKTSIERSLLKKPIEFVKKTGVSAVLACSLAFAGCGAPIAVDPVAAVLGPPMVIGTAVDLFRGHYPKHKHENHVGFDERNGVLWHVHSTDWYSYHGYSQYRGVYLTLGDDSFKEYKLRKPYLTSADYHEVEVIFEEGGIYRKGLAIEGDSSNTITVLIGGTSTKSYKTSIDNIVGVRISHYTEDYINNDSIVFIQNDILPFEQNIYTPEEMSDKISGLTASRGEIVKLFSNGMSVLWDPNYGTNVLVKSGVAGW